MLSASAHLYDSKEILPAAIQGTFSNKPTKTISGIRESIHGENFIKNLHISGAIITPEKITIKEIKI